MRRPGRARVAVGSSSARTVHRERPGAV